MENLGNFIINLIINYFDFIFSLSFEPLLSFISDNIPPILQGSNAIIDVFNLVFQYIGWILDFSGLSDLALDFIFLYLIFKVNALIIEKPIKLFLKYWETLI